MLCEFLNAEKIAMLMVFAILLVEGIVGVLGIRGGMGQFGVQRWCGLDLTAVPGIADPDVNLEGVFCVFAAGKAFRLSSD